MRVRAIFYTSHFARAMRRLPRDLKFLVAERECIFRENCFDRRLKTHQLKGKLKGFWSFSLTHAHRVLFQFTEDEVAVFIDIGDYSIYH